MGEISHGELAPVRKGLSQNFHAHGTASTLVCECSRYCRLQTVAAEMKRKLLIEGRARADGGLLPQ